jgi:hypothetical protein
MSDPFPTLWNQLSSIGADAALAERIRQFGAQQPDGVDWALLQAELLRRQGRHGEALELLSAISPELTETSKARNPRRLALLRHTRGLLLREQGRFAEAGRDFIDAFSLDGTALQSVHALQFTRLSEAERKVLINPFQAAVLGGTSVQPLAMQLLADWQQQLGEGDRSCALSYRAAQLSVSEVQRPWLDRLNPPDLPEALIIGAPKSGTTSLAGWLSSHPQIYVHPRKELHFFDNRWHWGADWYRCQFPRFRPDSPSVRRLEATPNYLQLGEVPERVRALMPRARLIVMLRDPLQRAISWCQHIIRQEGVARTPAELLEEEMSQLEACGGQPWRSDGSWHPNNGLTGSLYGSQLARWRSCFPDHQILVLQMERTILEPAGTWQRISDFLQINTEASPPAAPGAFPLLNAAPATHAALPSDLCRRLQAALAAETELWRSL